MGWAHHMKKNYRFAFIQSYHIYLIILIASVFVLWWQIQLLFFSFLAIAAFRNDILESINGSIQ